MAQTPNQPKPKNGVLKYGNLVKMENEPFWKLEVERKKLVAAGLDAKLFSKHYYYGK